MKTLPLLLLAIAAASAVSFFVGATTVACALIGFGIASVTAAEYGRELKPIAIRG